MTQFLYLSFVCDQPSLEAKLNELGRQGWRLHTCEPVMTFGPAGNGPLQAFVVMDMAVVEEPGDNPAEDAASEGIPMKG